MRLIFLDGFKGTDRVPVEAVPREGRRVFARTLERDAEGEYRVEALDEPGGVERDDLGAFVIAMLESLVREREPRTADVFVSSASRICLDGAVDALVELDARGWRIFCWDLLEAEAADPHDAIRRLLRRDGSTRLDDPWVAAVLRDIALATACGDMRMRSYSPSVADASCGAAGRRWSRGEGDAVTSNARGAGGSRDGARARRERTNDAETYVARFGVVVTTRCDEASTHVRAVAAMAPPLRWRRTRGEAPEKNSPTKKVVPTRVGRRNRDVRALCMCIYVTTYVYGYLPWNEKYFSTKKDGPDKSRTRNLLIWSQTHYHCATEPRVS